MNTARPITIVGGGLAGLTLGIGLRKRNVPVTVVEANGYPRHRVCGEFISGNGLETLKRLNLTDQLIRAGARSATTAAFFSTRTTSGVRQLPVPALCLSRYALDEILSDVFRKMGGNLEEHRRWANGFDEGIIKATGRRIEVEVEGWRWFGLKAHASDVKLDADLEMHLTTDGYVGICKLPDNKVNVCGLFRSRQRTPQLATEWKQWLSGSPPSKLNERLRNAVFDDSSFCSIAGICLKPRSAETSDECCIGDAMTMIPPVTGNGMSMAFESAELAIEPIAEFSRGALTWPASQKSIAAQLDNAFRQRLKWASRLQRLLFQPILSDTIAAAVRLPGVWRLLFSNTR